MKENDEQMLAQKNESFALVPTNKLVKKTSAMLRWKPETLIRNIKQWMSSPVEQFIYLDNASQFSHQPKTFKQILKVIAHDDLRICDLEETIVNGQKFSSKVKSIEPILTETLHLIRRIPNEYDFLRLKATTAASLVMAYGSDAITFIDSIAEEWVEIAEALHFYSSSQDKVVRAAIWMWANKITPYCKKQGIPDQVRFMDYFEDDCGDLRYHMIQLGETAEDILEENEEI